MVLYGMVWYSTEEVLASSTKQERRKIQAQGVQQYNVAI